MKENFHNSRTSDDIDMEFGPETKLGKKNKTMSKQFDHDVMSSNCNVIIIFSMYGQFGAIWKSDSRCIVCKSYIFSNINLLSWKPENRTKKTFKTTLTLLLWVKVPFLSKMLIFLQKKADLSKIKTNTVLKGILSKTTYACVLMYQHNSHLKTNP